MIRLMYVKGINRVDTPMFEDIADQQTFFDNCVVKEIKDGYYPPFYENWITLDSSDISIVASSDTDATLTANYLELAYVEGNQQREYYYFIDDIRYVADGIYRLHIVMDTIQSYYTEILLTETFVNRAPIKRWNDDGTINRDYIRENLSTAEQEELSSKSLTSLDSNDGLSWIVVVASDRIDEIEYTTVDSINVATFGLWHMTGSNDEMPSTGGAIYLIPLIDGKFQNVRVKVSSYSSSFVIYANPKRFENIATDSRVANIFYLPFNPFSAISYDADTELMSIASGIAHNTQDNNFTNFLPTWFFKHTASAQDYFDGLLIVWPVGTSQAVNPTGSAMEVWIKRMTRSLLATLPDGGNFVQNNTPSVIFDPKYVPALMDENYMNTEISYQGASFRVPYHLIDSATLYYNIEGYATGSARIFFGQSSTDFSVSQDPYGASFTVTLPQFDLYTDVWKNYQVNHQGSLITDWLGAGLHGAGQLAQAGSFMASRAEYGKRYEQRSALQAMRYQQRTEAYITGFDTLVKSVNEARESIEDMAIGIDQYTRGRK